MLAQFQGIIAQTPPVYSALKHNGKRYYELARAGLPVNPRPRQVEISGIELVNFKIPFLTIKVECSKGTYIRSLAQDIGIKLGCYAHLTNLTRLKCGPFSIEAAQSLDQIADARREGKLESLLYPIDTPLLDLETLIASKKIEAAIVNGQSIPLDDEQPRSAQAARRPLCALDEVLVGQPLVGPLDEERPDHDPADDDQGRRHPAAARLNGRHDQAERRGRQHHARRPAQQTIHQTL